MQTMKIYQTVQMHRLINTLWAHVKSCMFISLDKSGNLGPVVQSFVSLTSSLRVISLTVLADSI